eukprot:TRINITY_DN46796_c0_g1_i1.p2 TRINITY_DN46796_c0_g1~~TRINITY_DN46796_c0_g1_i1.p2  ORF type:complete len:100 (+),score=18.84 TRINITY_DN46796_c0_g1_i1:121-420(+)
MPHNVHNVHRDGTHKPLVASVGPITMGTAMLMKTHVSTNPPLKTDLKATLTTGDPKKYPSPAGLSNCSSPYAEPGPRWTSPGPSQVVGAKVPLPSAPHI